MGYLIQFTVSGRLNRARSRSLWGVNAVLTSIAPPAIADGDRGEYLAPDRIFPDIIIDDFRPLLLRSVGRSAGRSAITAGEDVRFAPFQLACHPGEIQWQTHLGLMETKPQNKHSLSI